MKRLPYLVAAATLALACVVAAHARGAEKSEPKIRKAKIKAVDPKGAWLLVEVPPDTDWPKARCWEINVNADTKVTLDNKSYKVADLPAKSLEKFLVDADGPTDDPGDEGANDKCDSPNQKGRYKCRAKALTITTRK